MKRVKYVLVFNEKIVVGELRSLTLDGFDYGVHYNLTIGV